MYLIVQVGEIGQSEPCIVIQVQVTDDEHKALHSNNPNLTIRTMREVLEALECMADSSVVELEPGCHMIGKRGKG